MKWIQKKPIIPYSSNDSVIEKLAKIRGIDNINEWLEPPLSYEHDPYQLDNIDKAVERIVKAIHFDEKISIMSDVDADGILSCSIMFNYLNPLTENVSIVHAQRSHGHGLDTILEENHNKDDVEYLDKDTQLLVIVDSSSNSVDACKIVKEKYGIDIVIIDHHLVDVDNPYATIVNCQLGDYPNKNASGTAMCYKVLQVLDDYLGIEQADEYLDLVAIGLVADLMNLQEKENRSLINRGMKLIKNEGLQQLLKVNKVDFYYGLNTTDIGFKISPLFNACSRYDKLELALELLTEYNQARAKEIAKELKKLNDKRKIKEQEIVEEVIQDIQNNHKIAVIVNNDIEANFRGLICMQIVSKLKKPAFVLTYNSKTNEYHGSARSISSLDLKELCEKTGNFIYCQGHEKAFGLGIKKDKLEETLDILDKFIQGSMKKESIYYDLEIEANEITKEMIIEIEKFSRITGQGVPSPRFLIKSCVVQDKEMLGKKKKETMKLNCENDLAIMKFKVDESYANDIEDALEDEENFFVEIDAIGSLNLNRYYHFGKKEMIITNQIFLEEYKIVD